MRRAADAAVEAVKAGVKAKPPFLVTAGSERIYQTIKRDGMVETFQKIGGTVLANACGPCIGQWKRSDVGKEETNTIVSSFNRNFPGRNDGSASTLSFLTTPAIVTAIAFGGTLDRISDNMLLGAGNAFTGEAGKGVNPVTGEAGKTFTQIARDLKARGVSWVVIGDENYGEGSSREHAAMSPRYLGGKVVIVKSFARIHETNLKKQGILPLTFPKTSDYDLFEQADRVGVKGLAGLAPGKPVAVAIAKADGKP